jgi:hypothetical protein
MEGCFPLTESEQAIGNRKKPLNEAPAIRAVTDTRKFSVVMGVAIIKREFCPSPDKAEGIKFCTFPNNSHKGIRGAGMIDESESRCLVGTIDRLSIIHLDNSNPLLGFGSFSPFSVRNAFSFVLADFLAPSQRDLGE